MRNIVPVIMSGGSGSRLWPVSRKARPKQFHVLGGERTLIQETALRSSGEMFDAPVVICNESQAAEARAQLAEAGVAPQLMILEPQARNTAPCAVAAAAILAARDPDALMLLAPADHRIADLAAYRTAVEAGRRAAEDGALVVFGIKPTRPETGYGYIRSEGHGDAWNPVERFVEKPDLATAEVYIADPAYSWNAGIFLFKVSAFLAEARRLAPEVAAAAEAAAAETVFADGVGVLGSSFGAAPSISIDYAVMEKTDKAVVVPCDMGWSDVGAWRELWELADKDAAGNAVDGQAIMAGAEGCLVRSDGMPVVMAGVKGLAVVVHDGVILVSRLDDSQGVKEAVEAMTAAGRGQLL
jgi:mannose-1-phosphate guanylyltransferase/mannose-6-phosphate isomerase